MDGHASASGRDAAWDAVHEALPARWCVGMPSFDPGVVRSDGYRGAWSVTARGPHPGRGKIPKTVTGRGKDEFAALQDLDSFLRGRTDAGMGMVERRRGLRLAYVDGAEEWSRENVGRSLTIREIGGVLRQFPGR